MHKYVFAFKNYKTNQDRDCVAYLDIDQLRRSHVGIDGKFTLHGACYSMSFNDDYQYGYVKTILSRDEFELMRGGYVTEEIIEKLLGEDNQNLFNEIVEEETEHWMKEYGLDEADIEKIFSNYYLDYRDRAIVGAIFDNSENLGYEEASSLGFIDNNSVASQYFDYERFGEDLLNGEQYLELEDGRVVYLMY